MNFNPFINGNKSSSSSDLINYYNKTETDTKLEKKIDKEKGKGLSTNDFTDDYKTKLNSIDDFNKIKEDLSSNISINSNAIETNKNNIGEV